MRRTDLLPWGASLLLSSCSPTSPLLRPTAPVPPAAVPLHAQVITDSTCFVDPAGQRPIPVVTYAPGLRLAINTPHPPKLRVALLSHGYGGRNTAYSFLAHYLVAHGYFVVSLQHELPGDAPIATTGNLAQTRRPHWERGVQSLLFVLRELRRTHPALDYRRVLLVGHSNGGDMAMLFAHEHPKLVWRVISLDNRRMPLPRTRRPQLLSLRSSDQVADEGVLPTPAEQAKFGIAIVKLRHTRHNDLWDGATPQQKQEIKTLISAFVE